MSQFLRIFLPTLRFLVLFGKGKTHFIAKFHKTGLVICSQFRERKTLSYSQINTVYIRWQLSFQNNSENLDLCYKTDLDFRYCFGRKT